MDLDLETVHENSGSPRMDGWISILVGLITIAASLIGLMEFHANQSEERNLVRASRRSVDVFTRLATRGTLFSFSAEALRDSITLTSEAELRRALAFQALDIFAAENSLATADAQAARSLMTLAETLSEPVEDPEDLDRQTAAVIATDQDEIDRLTRQQNGFVDVAESYGSRGVKGMFGLSLIALAAVMVALAGMFGDNKAGHLALLSSGTLLTVASGWSLLAFLA
jgi:hypothetical protein